MISTVPSERDPETGQFVEEYPPSAFIEAVGDLEPATTSSVAEEVGCSYDLAYRRLKELEQSNEVVGMEVGNTFLWSVTG